MYLGAILVYLGILAAFGVRHSRQVRTGDDFLVAGRTLPARVLVFTLLATWIGSGSLFGGAGLGYRAGFPALWQSAGAWAGILLVFFLAPRVRRIAKYTMPDILELRYGAAARVLGTITTVIAYTTIAAYQFRGGGRLLSLVSPAVDPSTGALITAGFCVAYTALAGMMSVAYLDVGNGLMMLVGVIVAVGALVAQAGGLGPALGALRPDQVSLFGTLDPVTDAFALFLPTLLLLMGEANMYQKFFSAKDEGAARRAVAGWIVGTVIVETLIDSVGVFGSAAIPGLDRAQSETIVIRAALQLPLLLGLLLLCGAAAIIVSTANSFLLTPASNLMRDVYQRFVNPSATDRQVVLYTRLLVVVLGALGLVALNFFTTILAMALWAYTMYGAAITPALLAAFVWPRATRQGGVASIAAGMTVTLVWEIVAMLRAPAGGDPVYFFGLPTVYPALAASLAGLFVVSLLTSPPTEEELKPLR